MELHEASKAATQGLIDRIKAEAVPQKQAQPFMDPLREFASASKIKGTVAAWLTYPIEERKRLIKSAFLFVPRQPGDEAKGIPPESEKAFESRQLERWRALNVIIQEESRAPAGNRSAQVAIGALKLLFPEHDWQTPVPPKG